MRINQNSIELDDIMQELQDTHDLPSDLKPTKVDAKPEVSKAKPSTTSSLAQKRAAHKETKEQNQPSNPLKL
jgi:hypothetical protein